MSRVGKKTITIPQGVKVNVHASTVQVEGPKGKLTVGVESCIKVEVKGDEINCVISNVKADNANAKHGLVRNLIANAIEGCKDGFVKTLEINGTGYRAGVKGKDLELSLGFSHQVLYPIPEGIQIAVDKQTKLAISGADKRLVGQTAAEIRQYRKPEPYKGKGVKYGNEVINRKAGKAAGAGK